MISLLLDFLLELLRTFPGSQPLKCYIPGTGDGYLQTRYFLPFIPFKIYCSAPEVEPILISSHQGISAMRRLPKHKGFTLKDDREFYLASSE
jgi:hypothetical protein